MRYCSSPAQGNLFGEERFNRYKIWLPAAASDFHAIVENFWSSGINRSLGSYALAMRPSPLFDVISCGHIVTNVSLTGLYNDSVQTDTLVYLLPSTAKVYEPRLVFVPAAWLCDQTIRHDFHRLITSIR